jgi:hypothetical protein
MNPISISINDTRYFNTTLNHVPRLYDLSKKLAFFVRYLNTNYEGLFINGGVSGNNNSGVGCFFLVNGQPFNTGDRTGDEVGISSADRGFLSREQFDDNEFGHFAESFVRQFSGINITINRRAN